MTFPPLVRIACALLLPTISTYADVRLPAIISDHMVLEKTAKVPIWGKADPGESVTVKIAGQTTQAVADADGRWMATLDLSSTEAGPFEMLVEGNNKLIISDVLIGEVWVASGQSNMEWSVEQTSNANTAISSSENPMIRQFLVKKNPSDVPTEELTGEWTSASPETTAKFTAVGYYFAKKLNNELQLPIGIINSSWGGTPSEAWTSPTALATDSDLSQASERMRKAAKEFPPLKADYIKNFGAWLQKNQREDIPVKDASIYAGMDVSTEDWTPVQVPGIVRGTGLPESGVVWLRKEIDLPESLPEQLPLNLSIDGFDSIYWNGKLLNQVTYNELPDIGTSRQSSQYRIPAKDLKAGKNVLVIRLFEPVKPAELLGQPKAGNLPLAGKWLAKAEHSYPPLSADAQASAPTAPTLPAKPQNIPAFLFNGMIHPILPYAISGAIWYQGESNAGRAEQYNIAFPLLISDWRKQWNQGDFPLYFCQLANFKDKLPDAGESDWAELREAQLATLSLPNTGQAVLIDIGESKDIHPRNKKDVGERLALIALANDYGKSIPFSGPVYDSMKVEGDKITLSFNHTDGGLVAAPLSETYDVKTVENITAPLIRNSPDSELEGFAICGEDRVWVWADARIDGDQVIVSSDKVPSPVAVRYAWADNPTCNLYNGAGLPASPFRTDDFPPLTAGKKL